MAASIECRSMNGPERVDAFGLMQNFRIDERRLGAALAQFVEREDYGFVWLAYRAEVAVGCCSVGYTIATVAGGVVALVRDLYVMPGARRGGVASAMLEALQARLKAFDVVAFQVAATDDPGLLAFLAARRYTASAGLFTALR